MNNYSLEEDTQGEPAADHWLMQWVEEKVNDFETVELDEFILTD